MIPSSTKKKTGVVRLPTIKPHPFVRDFHFEFPSSWHCTPSCLVSRQSGAVFHPGPPPVVSASLNSNRAAVNSGKNKKPPDGGDGRPGADEQSGRTRLSSQTLSDYGVTIR